MATVVFAPVELLVSGLDSVDVDALGRADGIKPNVIHRLACRDQIEIDSTALAVELNQTDPVITFFVDLEDLAWYPRNHACSSYYGCIDVPFQDSNRRITMSTAFRRAAQALIANAVRR